MVTVWTGALVLWTVVLLIASKRLRRARRRYRRDQEFDHAVARQNLREAIEALAEAEGRHKQASAYMLHAQNIYRASIALLARVELWFGPRQRSKGPPN